MQPRVGYFEIVKNLNQQTVSSKYALNSTDFKGCVKTEDLGSFYQKTKLG